MNTTLIIKKLFWGLTDVVILKQLNRVGKADTILYKLAETRASGQNLKE